MAKVNIWKVLITAVLSIALIAGAVDLNKNRAVYPASTEENPLEGYWSSTGITSAYVSNTPTGVVYNITIAPDTIEVGSSIDIPLWKHWGVTGSYGITVVDTNANFVTTDDSVCAYVGLRYLAPGGGQVLIESISNATTNGDNTLDKAGENFLTTVSLGDIVTIYGGTTVADYGTYTVVDFVDDTQFKISTALTGSDADVDFTVHNDGRESFLIVMLCDSAAGGNTRLGGAAWVNFVTGEIDLTSEDDWWERMIVTSAQSSVAAVNDILSIRVTLTLPYSDSYLRSEYYKKYEVTK